MSCGVGHRHSLDLALWWLWHRPVATAPIPPLAWESSYAVDATLKRPPKNDKCENELLTRLAPGHLFLMHFLIWLTSPYQVGNVVCLQEKLKHREVK